MADYTISSGRSSQYPETHYGGHFIGTRATFCVDADFPVFDANTVAIPNLPVVSLVKTPVTVSDRFFGAHVKYRENDAQAEYAAGSVRSHDLANGKSRWQFIETSDDVWDFSDLDFFVNTHYAAGHDILFTLFGTPTWASARPTERNAYSDQVDGLGQWNRGITAEPSDMAKWDRFCAKIATRYLGKIKYYEVWNEPNYGNAGAGATSNVNFYSGTFAKLAEMVRRANQTIKGIDPTAKIVCPALTSWSGSAGGSAETYFTGMMAASTGDGSTTMKDWVDIVGVHLYVGGNTVNNLPKFIDRVKAGMATAGISSKEIWDTESAPIGPDVSGLSVSAAKKFIARSMLVQAAKGISRTFYYQYDNPTMGVKGLTDILDFMDQTRSLLMGGTILAAAIFNDGRVGYYTTNGVLAV